MSEKILKKLQELLETILNAFTLSYSLQITKETDQFRINIKLDQEETILNEEGNLEALQYVLRTLIRKIYPQEKIHFILDLNYTKQEREQIILTKIPKVADDLVLKKGKIVVLIGFSGYERLLVHSSLRDVKNIETQSVGVGSNRKLIILPTSEIGVQGIDDSIILDIHKLKNI